MNKNIQKILDEYGISLEDFLEFIEKLLSNNPFLLSEAKALIECQRKFQKQFIRTNLLETPDLKSIDDEIWVEVKDFRGLAPGSLTISKKQIADLLNGLLQGKKVYLAVVTVATIIFIDLCEMREYLEEALRSEKGFIKLLSKLNEKIERKILNSENY